MNNMVRSKFKSIEKKWQKIWEKEGWYQAVDGDKKKKKRYVLVEFPYPSGEGLHIGHTFTMTGADVYARKKRMDGFNVLFPMGWDAFGLPTENYAIKTGIHPKTATKNNTDKFRRQMKKMAFSFDWRREINTADPSYYKWTQWIFIQLFKHGLAYKRKMPINWCPSCKIGLANEEVVNGRCERCGAEVSRRDLDQWIVKITDYADRLIEGLEKTAFIEKVRAAQINWIGRSEGARVKFKIKDARFGIKDLEVFTTRPDTLWGATFMVVAPEHELVTRILGLKSAVPDSKRKEIKSYIDRARKKSDLERTELEKDKTGVFTGFYAINPVNNQEIPIWISDFVLISYGTGAIMAVPAHDERDWQFAKKYQLPIIPVIEPKGGWDFDQAPYTDVDRGRVVNSGLITGLAPKEAIKKVTAWLEKKRIGRRAVSYHLRDWIFSRQHYWGEPIPMIYCQKCGWQPVPEEQLPVKLPEVDKYQPTDTGESPLANIKDWVRAKCPQCGGEGRRETDTMPNWAGSDWYFIRYIDPGNDRAMADMEKMRYWLPVDVYVGGDEHNTLHLLYSRFIYQFLWDIGAVPKEYPEPYYRRLSHGVILGSDGQKMSKSYGNVVNPDKVADQFGVDTLRTYMMFMGPFEGTMAWNDSALKGVARFLDKLERVIKKAKNVQGASLGRHHQKEESAKRRIHRLIKKVSDDLENFRFNTAIAAIMEAVNYLLEPTAGSAIGKNEAKVLIQLIAPFAPYLAEELWHQLGEKGSVHSSSWPKADPQYLVEDQAEIVVQVNGKFRGVISISAAEAKNQSRVEKEAKKDSKAAKYLKGRRIKRTIFVPGRLINFVC